MDDAFTPALSPAKFIDSDHPAIRDFAQTTAGAVRDPRERAVRLYYAVRDGLRYDPYSIDLSDKGLKASTALATGRGWCVTKGALLAAVCRAADIPAKVGFADVRNHLSTARMREVMQTDVYIWHGYTSIYLDGNWVKATPAFNVELCRKFSLKPLEFDGREDSIYHPCDLAGNRHMEYLRFRGEWDDIPVDELRADFVRCYPHLPRLDEGDFEVDVESETALK